MTRIHKFRLGDKVILNGYVGGATFKDTYATIIALINSSEYYYCVKFDKDSNTKHGHTATWSVRQLTEYDPKEMHFGMSGSIYIKSSTGYDCYNVPQDIISLAGKEYDPTQQPYDDGDI